LCGLLSWGTASADVAKSGSELGILGTLPGDQSNPDLALSDSGGYLVAEDSLVDGSGSGIRARRFFANLASAPATFQVNSQGLGEQRRPKVAVQPGGNAAFVWQSSTAAGLRVFARFANPAGVFYSTDVRVSSDESGSQQNPAVAALADGGFVVVWAVWERDGDMQGVFGQRFSAAGAKLGAEFQVNVLTKWNQRSPAVAGLGTGGFVVAWISEDSSGTFEEETSNANNMFAVHTRIYAANGAVGPVRQASERGLIVANPEVTGVSSQGYRVAWSQRKLIPGADGWDIVTRSFDPAGSPLSEAQRVNEVSQGDQYVPRLASVGEKQFAVWTSLGQDGYDEGVYGRALIFPGGFDGGEMRVNTTTVSKQIHPAVAALGEREFVGIWAGFVGGEASFDIFGQSFQVSSASALPAPGAPMVSPLSQTSLGVGWPSIESDALDTYLVYVDGGDVAHAAAGGFFVSANPAWAAGSSHSFQIAYRLKDGRVSPRSEATSGTTWGADSNADGLPDEWQTANWGKSANWPAAGADSDGDGASNRAEFLAGTDPSSAASVLRLTISLRDNGPYLEWNTEPGNVYQLQTTVDFAVWQNLGAPRFAPSAADAIPVVGPAEIRWYRLIRLR